MVDPFIDIFLGLPLSPTILHDFSGGKVNHYTILCTGTDIEEHHTKSTNQLPVVLPDLFALLGLKGLFFVFLVQFVRVNVELFVVGCAVDDHSSHLIRRDLLG